VAASALSGTLSHSAPERLFANCSPTSEIAHNQMPISTMTKRFQARGMHRQLSAGQPGVPSGVIQAVLMHALQLRRSCREVFLLCDIQRHSVSEAAEILGISRTAATKRLRLARRRMDEVIDRLCAPYNKPVAELTVNDADVSCGL
jgi:predicted DNA-binding protein (UPF0251 family)